MTSLLSRFSFRPRFWPSLLTLTLLTTLLYLGFWQLERLEWKESLIAELEARREAPPISLETALEDPAQNEYRSVALEGEYRHGGELYWLARTYESRSGYHILTPLRLEDGREILVDRGWMPGTAPEANAGDARRPDGFQEISAVLRRGGWGGPAWLADFLRPENRPEANEWLWPDLPAMAEAAGMEQSVTDAYVTLLPAGETSGETSSLPRAQAPRVDLKNDHLSYAITWFTLAGALLVIYLLFHLRPRPPGSGPRPSGRPAG